MAPYKVLYSRKCRTPSCWTELGERRVMGPELVSDTEEKVKLIRDRLREASDKQKSYADLKCQEIEFSVGVYVFLKVSPWKKILRFGWKVEEIEVRPDLTFEEEPVQILDREVKVLRKKSIPLVKVLWRNHSSEEATWKPKEISVKKSAVNFRQWIRWAKSLLPVKIFDVRRSLCIFINRCVITHYNCRSMKS
ncbi:uncharacterized protein LOC128042520 [Gossypium raimondii]|uniref:uncharacterized protein LOC128042520 n=1 Tax=Gossypium raimondii TaxID=29730 RepID=UPI00227A909B|nr:uncharacterized protein LOC128042520 [Gossypium raimondii]